MRRTAIQSACLLLLVGVALSLPVGRGSAQPEGQAPVVSTENCLKCHGEVLKQPVQHAPVSGSQCLSCHTPVRSDRANCESGYNWKLILSSRELCQQCHAPDAKGEGASKIPVDLGAKVVHKPVAEEECTTCHAPHSSKNPKLLVSKRPGMCFLCHEKEKVIKQNVVHQPLAEGQCNQCHDAHASPNEHLLKASGSALCLTCHKTGATGEGVSKLQFDPTDGKAHKPVIEGECTDCHAPHSAKNAKLLLGKRPNMCFLCHEKPEFAEGRSVHPPVPAGRCNECHDPHVSKNDHLLKQESKITLCLGCHGPGAQGQGLARIKINLDKKVVHSAFKESNCLDCHEPHRSDQKKLLDDKQPNLCYKCHQSSQFETDFVHSAVALGKCSGCHDPHSSDHGKLLREEGSALCFQCHADDVTGREAVHSPVAKGDCLTCHSPHGSQHENNLVRGDPTKTCLSCHGPDGESTRKIDLKKATVHGAISSHGCTACHDPHGSDNPRLLVRDINALCVSCHKDQESGYHIFRSFDGRPHPTSGPKNPANPKEPFRCTSCHDPHSSASPKLWRTGEQKMDSCKLCHDKDAKSVPPTPVKKEK